MYRWKVNDDLQKKLKKISKKNLSLYNQIFKKINGIIFSSDVEHYKNLRHNMKDSKRVQIGHFVLVFQYNKKENLILFDDFDHHDKIDKK